MRSPDVSVADVVGKLQDLRTGFDAWRGKQVPGENVFDFRGPETVIQFHGQGLGDMMIIRQFGRAFADYLRDVGDPELGKVVVSCGGYKATFNPEPGDVNCYWWWSFGPKDDEPAEYLDFYLDEVSVEPDVILCLSERCKKEASQRGFDTVYLPLGTQAFEPLGVERSGLGYAGSRYHKDRSKSEPVLGPYGDRDDFEWVSHFVTPTQLNLWYNTKLVTFGLTKEGQRRWGMVNNRVFETLASGTPFILESHPTVEDVLGFEFPYQTSSREETLELTTDVLENPDQHLERFRSYAETVREEHSYDERVRTLVSHL
ncbi:glycosyltransferase [Haloplanus sp. GCM10025708]|uniref:glycosyltransferase family protein n=1 Tax=Haloferacaceae TaxID=1644056 RepID=UPI003608B4A4